MEISPFYFRMIFFSLEPKILILRDISVDQYVMEKSPVNLETTQKVMEKLAKFHALSYFLLNDNHDESIASYTEGFMSERMKGNAEFITQMLGLGTHVIRGWGKEMEKVADRLAILAPGLFQKMIKFYSANAPGTGYNVLNHGDFHLRNMLFKWQEGPEKIAESIQFVRNESFKVTVAIFYNQRFISDRLSIFFLRKSSCGYYLDPLLCGRWRDEG